MLSLFFCQQQTNFTNYNRLQDEVKCGSLRLQRVTAQASIWLRSGLEEAGIFLVRLRTVNKHCSNRCSCCLTSILPPVQCTRASLKVNHAGRRLNSVSRDFRISANSAVYAAFCLLELQTEADCSLFFKDSNENRFISNIIRIITKTAVIEINIHFNHFVHFLAGFFVLPSLKLT